MPNHVMTILPASTYRAICTLLHAHGVSVPFTEAMFNEWVWCAANDALSLHLEWATLSNLTESFLEGLPPELKKAEIVDEINRMLKSNVKEPIWGFCTNPWYIYHTSAKYGILFIERDRDYRVEEWYRLTGTPE